MARPQPTRAPGIRFFGGGSAERTQGCSSLVDQYRSSGLLGGGWSRRARIAATLLRAITQEAAAHEMPARRVNAEPKIRIGAVAPSQLQRKMKIGETDSASPTPPPSAARLRTNESAIQDCMYSHRGHILQPRWPLLRKPRSFDSSLALAASVAPVGERYLADSAMKCLVYENL